MVRHAAKPKKKKGPAAAAAATAAAAAVTASAVDSDKPQFFQQVSRKGSVNALSTSFLREEDSVVAERKVRAQDPFGTADKSSLVCEPSGPGLGLPLRPAVLSDAKSQQQAEETTFAAWLAEVNARCGAEPGRVSPFEHNLEVWRQLWRTLERSDVVAIVADVRNPLLHVPAALYEHVAKTLRLRLVIVLSKVGRRMEWQYPPSISVLTHTHRMHCTALHTLCIHRLTWSRPSTLYAGAPTWPNTSRRHGGWAVPVQCIHMQCVRLCTADMQTTYAPHHAPQHRNTATPQAHLAEFSSQGRPVGGSLGGGVNARRRSLKAPLTAAEQRMVRTRSYTLLASATPLSLLGIAWCARAAPSLASSTPFKVR